MPVLLSPLHSNGASPHELVVLNRKNPENFVAEITPRLALDTSNPEFLFLRSPSKDVFGLWFHDQTQIAPSVAFIMKSVSSVGRGQLSCGVLSLSAQLCVVVVFCRPSVPHSP